ncbi:hypothetical protein OH799_08795 [Nocardia sp. NBC_00881]|uniref:hypothetical protein n=1 Tax=Nocardia sp. NBC_00881 TaxID=2975995 RepID=UPI0038632E80|nr:hypothetical protein OH799_08795 [Nocardia sp. NBC_00881]
MLLSPPNRRQAADGTERRGHRLGLEDVAVEFGIDAIRERIAELRLAGLDHVASVIEREMHTVMARLSPGSLPGDPQLDPAKI